MLQYYVEGGGLEFWTGLENRVESIFRKALDMSRRFYRWYLYLTPRVLVDAVYLKTLSLHMAPSELQTAKCHFTYSWWRPDVSVIYFDWDVVCSRQSQGILTPAEPD